MNKWNCGPKFQQITQLYFQEGSRVAKGALLVKLFDGDLVAQRKKLQFQKELADKNEQRLRQLLAVSGISQQEYDIATSQINTLSAEIEITDIQIQKTSIRAPFSGIIGTKNVSTGAYLTPANVIATLHQLNPIKLDFTVPEKYRTSIGNGDRLTFNVESHKEPFSAKVQLIDPQVDAETRMVRVRALAENAGGKLFPGTFAKVNLPLKETANALLVPTQAIIPEARLKKVVVVKNGKATFQTVETGVRESSMIQILSGVAVGDTVVVSGLMQLRPDAAVQVAQVVNQKN